jgi:sarcosine oxidase subunit beta
MKNTADVIIVGGGIIGASLAFHLSKRGVKPMVLERRFLAAGGTGRSSGLVRMHYDLELESRLAWVSFQYFRNWEEMVGGDCGFTRTGFIQIVPSEHTGKLRANVKMHKRIGIPSLLVDAEDVRRLAPSFSTEDIEVAAYEPESGYADPSGTTAAFMNAARQEGARLIQDCPVTGIQVEGGAVVGVDTPQGQFYAPVVVNAAGPWAAGIGRMAGLELPVGTYRHEVIFVNRPPEMGPLHPTVIDDSKSMYFRPETGRLTLVGLEEGNEYGVSPEGNTDRAKPEYVEMASERICERVPVMERGSLKSSQGGYDGITPDHRAILGQAGPEGFYLTCGFSGTGFKIAPAVGACMTELIMDGRAETVDISLFGLERMTKSLELKGEHSYGKQWN